MSEKRLGRGLRSLLESPTTTVETESGFREIPVASIDPNPAQPRIRMDEQRLKELSDSIATNGVLQPVVVRRRGDRFELIAGERRWRAARMAGLPIVPALVRDRDGVEGSLQLALIENLQREDLDPISKAKGFRRLLLEHGMTQEGVARALSIDRSTLANHLRLLELPDSIQSQIEEGRLSFGHGKAILSADSAEKRLELANRAATDRLSVRDTEALATRARGPGGPSPAAPWRMEIERRIRDAVGCRARVLRKGGRYEVTLGFEDQAGLDRFLERLRL